MVGQRSDGRLKTHIMQVQREHGIQAGRCSGGGDQRIVARLRCGQAFIANIGACTSNNIHIASTNRRKISGEALYKFTTFCSVLTAFAIVAGFLRDAQGVGIVGVCF